LPLAEACTAVRSYWQNNSRHQGTDDSRSKHKLCSNPRESVQCSLRRLEYICSSEQSNECLVIINIFICHYVKAVQRVSKRVSPHKKKLLRVVSLPLSLFCVKFCKFVGNLYSHYIYRFFYRFVLVFHQTALIFPRASIVFTLSSFE